MLRRAQTLVRACAAAGLVALLTSPGGARAQGPADRVPGRDAEVASVSILRAQADGRLAVDARGQGDSLVRLALRNQGDTRLNVVLPPGLVAAAASAQAGGGFQSMGLGVPTRTPGGFGAFAGADAPAGFRSMPAAATPAAGIAVAPGETVEVAVPAVCLNFGLPTPTPNDAFRLVDVADYTTDARAQRALRGVATIGTSQKVAQAVAWHTFNGLSFPQLAGRAGKVLNRQELALAGRFCEVLDREGTGTLVNADTLRQGRLYVTVAGEGRASELVERLARELSGQTLLGLPVEVVAEAPSADVAAPSLLLSVTVAEAAGTPEPTGRVAVSSRSAGGEWIPAGTATLAIDGTLSELDGARLAAAVDRGVAGTFVTARAAKRGPGGTAFRLENKLPFTVAAAEIRPREDRNAATVRLDGIGLGPARATVATLPAATAVVERITLNGL
jgi:hypothetical protein